MTDEREQHGPPPAHATGAVQFVAVEDIAPDETFRLRQDGDVSQLATALGRLGQLSPVELRRWPGAGSDGPQWQVVSGFRRLAAVRMLARERVLARLHEELGEEDAWGLALSEALLHQPLTGDELVALRERLRTSGVAPWAEDLVDEARVRAPVAAELRELFYDYLTATGDVPRPSRPAGAVEGAAEASGSPPSPSTEAPISISTSTSIEPSSSSEIPTAPSSTAEPPQSRDERDQGATPTVEQPVGAQEVEYVEVTPDELVQDLIGRLSTLNQDLATAVEAWADLPVEGRKSIVDQARYVVSLLPFMETPE